MGPRCRSNKTRNYVSHFLNGRYGPRKPCCVIAPRHKKADWETAKPSPAPTRATPFTRSGRAGRVETRTVTDWETPGSKGWMGAVLSGEARYAGGENIERPYEQAGWVHVALKAISSAVRSCPLRFYEADPHEEPGAIEVSDHPVVRLFKRPNPYMTPSKFWEAATLHRKLDGEDFWFLFDAQKNPVMVDAEGKIDLPDIIIPVKGSTVDELPGKNGFPAGWVYPSRDKIRFPSQAVVQFADYDPSNPLRGLGDVQVLLRDLALEFGAQRYLEAMLANSGDPGGYIINEEELSREEERAAERQAEEEFSVENKGRWRVISGKVKYEAAKFGPRDMEFEKLVVHVRNKTAAILGVPLPVLGVLEEATYSNYATAVAQFWQNGNGVLALLRSMEDVINHDFLMRLRDDRASGFVARFDTSHVEALQDDNHKKYELAQHLSQANIGLSFDEAARIVGLHGVETEYGSIAWLPPNIVAAEDALRASKDHEGPSGNGEDSPVGGSTQEEDDFPGSDDFESGSNGPTGSDGKGALSKEHHGDDVTAPDAQEGAPSNYFKGYEKNILEPGERAVRKAANDYLGRYKAAQERRLEDYAENGPAGFRDSKSVEKIGVEISPADIPADKELLNVLLLDLAEWNAKLAEKLKGPLENILREASEDFAVELGADAIGTSDPWALDYLKSQRIRLAQSVNTTLEEDVREALVRVFKDKPFSMRPLQDHVREVLPEIRGELRKVFKSRSHRASTIARTEVNRAASGTRFEMMSREGIAEHQWVSSGDQYVRDTPPHSHVALDGVIRAVGDSFREGTLLLHPGDPAGDPQDVINCRCVTRPIVKD